MGSKHAILLGALGLGVIAMLKKNSVENGWDFFPDIPHQTMGGSSWRHDWTLVKDPRDGKNWGYPEFYVPLV